MSVLYLSNIFNTCHFCFKKGRFVLRSWKMARDWVAWHWLCGIGDMDVPPFWPSFLTFWGLDSIFLGYFFSSTNTKTIFWGIKTTNSYRIRSFRPQISSFPRSFWVQVSAASGTPPSVFGPSTPPGKRYHNEPSWWRSFSLDLIARLDQPISIFSR